MTESKNNRRRFLVRGVELASTIPLVALLAKNFNEKREFYEANSSEAMYSGSRKSVNEFLNMQSGFQRSLDNLYSSYNDAYYVSHLETRISTDAKGNMKTDLVTVWDWEEPRNVPRHTVISSWENSQNHIAGKASTLAKKPLIDARNIYQIKLDKKHASNVGQGILNVGIYGSAITALLGYEELVAASKYSNHYQHGKKKLSEKVRLMNSDSQINRRSFFKVGAALAGATTANSLMKKNQIKSEQGKETLRGSIDSAEDKTVMGSENAFAKYFGQHYLPLKQKVQQIVSESRNILNNDVRNRGVRDSFNSIILEGENYLQKLNNFFENGVPKELGDLSVYALVTNEIEGISSSEKTRANLGILLEGLVVGGVMAGVLIPSEVINSKLK